MGKRLAALALVSVLAAAGLVTGCTRTVRSEASAATKTVEPTRTVVATPSPPAAEETTEVVRDGKKTMAGVAAASPGLSTFEELLEASGFDKTLGRKGEYTLFAPTNPAFEQLPAGWLEKLKDPANKEKLLALLRHHLVMGRVGTGDMLRLKQLVAFQGGLLTVHYKAPLIYIDHGSNITTAGVPASNGIIHVVDKVLVPKGFTP